MTGTEPGPAPPLRIGVVAGEASGDLLGAGLMAALRARVPAVEFVGVGGPRMRALGMESLVPAESLAVNGFVDPLRRAPELLGLLRRLARRLLGEGGAAVDAFVGVDFNVFNGLLERRLKHAGTPTVHYVSPSVYAWRRGRLKRLSRAVDHMLTLYPFEPPLYRDAGVEATFVGHPLADEIAPVEDGTPYRAALGVPAGAPLVLAVLPGSRRRELDALAGDFLAAAARVAEAVPGTVVLIPVLDAAARARLAPVLAAHPGLDVRVHEGASRAVLAASDLVLVKSGTATLEAMLVGRPMVVAYRVGPITYRILKRLVHTAHFALPNLLAGRELVPELIQDAATPAALAAALLGERERAPALRTAFAELGASLRRDASARAAEAVLATVAARRGDA
jgi:lipid-A-disaccharide synthase